ncbi:MAG: GNAT family N-acetyltransferase [Thiobacillus sp.]
MQQEKFEVRMASLVDIDNVMGLELNGFDIGIQERQEIFLGRITYFPEGFLILINKNSGETVGYVCSEIWDYQPFVSEYFFEVDHDIRNTHNSKGSELYISSMTIRPDYRSRGLGKFLFSECIRRIRVAYPNIKSATLMVNETWVYAKKIYDRLGFNEINRIHNFFTPVDKAPQASIIMRKTFENE